MIAAAGATSGGDADDAAHVFILNSFTGRLMVVIFLVCLSQLLFPAGVGGRRLCAYATTPSDAFWVRLEEDIGGGG